MAAAFFAASRHGDMAALRSLLATGVVVHADGGGRRPAASMPAIGIEAALALHEILAPLFANSVSRLVRYATVGGLPGFVTLEAGDTVQTTALDIREGWIVGIYVTRNPDKLRHLTAARWGGRSADGTRDPTPTFRTDRGGRDGRDSAEDRSEALGARQG